jgi:Domain of unknown function (DUF4845)
MDRRYSQRGITLSGMIYACIILGIIAVTGMRLYPLYYEKFQVDLALEKVAGQRESSRMTKMEIVKLIMRQFEVSDVDRWRLQEFAKILKIQKPKSGKSKIMSLSYEIRKPFFGELDIVLKYHKSLKLGEPVTD